MLLPTTLLHHTPAAGKTSGLGLVPHHDWLILPPDAAGDPAARLWTVRVGPHWREWAKRRRIELTALPPHRRRYLTYQGPLTGGRGRVRSAGRGWVQPHLWTERRIELTLRTAADERLALRLERAPGGRWFGVCGG